MYIHIPVSGLINSLACSPNIKNVLNYAFSFIVITSILGSDNNVSILAQFEY